MDTVSSFHIPYSLKNIPFLSKIQYQKMLTIRIEQFLTRMRWKLFWSKQEERSKKEFQTYGFKSMASPPMMLELIPFEEELIGLIQKIEMKNITNPLQKKMKKDIQKIKRSKEIIVEADKTSNLYSIKPEDYSRHLLNNITTEYSKSTPTATNRINMEAARNSIARNLELDERIEAMANKPAYLKLKDHKDDFPARLKFRLINPCNSNIGIISKNILDRINNAVKASTGLQQWRNTEDVL